MFDYLNPDYQPIWAQRIERLAKLEADPLLLAQVKVYYKHHPADFINDWGCTVNPKNVALGRPTVMPFMLYDKQREFITWVIERWQKRQRGVLVKSRECGASWMAMALSCTLGLFWEDVAIGFGSAKEEQLDGGGNPNTLFYKGRMFMKYIPHMFKGDWTEKKNSAHRRILFPLTNSAIVGDAGDNIGVGGRSTIFFLDEFAMVERPKRIEGNMSANTDCCIEMSTVFGIDNVFAEHARGGLIPRFDFMYVDDPTKCDPVTKQMWPWFKEYVATMDPMIFNQQYGCDFLASIEGGVIEPQHIQAAIGAAEKLGIKPSGDWVASYDVADLGHDKNAVCIRHGVELVHVEQWSGSNINPMISIRRAFEIADKYGCKEMIYDASGMGGTWHEYFAISNETRIKAKLKPIRMRVFQGGATVLDPESRYPGADRKNIDYFENFKAQCWMALRSRFEETYKAIQGEKYNPDNIISIPAGINALNTLMGELAQPTRKWSKNQKLMIDKTPEGVASPNIADSVMQAFGYSRPPMAWSQDLLEQL